MTTVRAIWTLYQPAEDEAKDYFDYLLSRADSKEEAIFKIPYEAKLSTLVELNKRDPIKTLEMWWNPTSVEFSFKINIPVIQNEQICLTCLNNYIQWNGG